MPTLTPYARGSLTSQQAARAIRESAAPLCQHVLAFIRERGIHGATRQEIEAGLNLIGDTVRPRVRSLLDAGYIEVSDEVRRTASGRAAEVLVAHG